jgi:histidinol-phosphatase (PHP family)
MKIDYHIHTSWTRDAVNSAEEYCRQAIKIGLKEICFTNHQEWSYVIDRTYHIALRDEDWKKHIKEIEDLKKKFPSLIIKLGTELGYYEKYENEILDFIRKYDFDYIIGSIHCVDGVKIVNEIINDSISYEDAVKCYKKYFYLMERLIDLKCFNCIGHFELPRKELPQVKFEEYKEFIIPCIKKMKENNIGFELNTGGFRRHIKEQYPRLEILKILKENNIDIVTIGSDCHKIEELGSNINEGLKILKNIGYDKICTFSKKKPIFNKIIIND